MIITLTNDISVALVCNLVLNAAMEYILFNVDFYTKPY